VRNRLVGAVSSAGVWTFEYDAFGNRTAAIRDGIRTEYLLDPTGFGNIVAEFDAVGRPVAHFTHGLGLESRTAGSETLFFEFDVIGSTAGISNAAGGYVNRYAFSPFGKTLVQFESVPNLFAFVGQFGVTRDRDGQYLMGERTYSPLQGRFVTPDPIRLYSGDANF